MLRYIGLLCFTVHSFLSFGQEGDSLVVLTELKTSIADDRVGVTFTLGKGSFCYGAQLERTLDTLDHMNFTEIGEIEGVCGHQDFETSYTLWDERPITNRPVYYRVITGFIPTKFLQVEVPFFGKENHSISPNPMREYADIQLPAQTNGTIRFVIFNTNGETVENRVVGSGNLARFTNDNLKSGLFIYQIYLDDEFYASGKLMVR